MINPPDSWWAAVLRETNSRLEMVEIARPELQAGQVLVRLDFSGVCRSQLMEVRGLRGFDKWLPHLLGHEGVGTIVDIGRGVTKVAQGDRVIVGWIMGEGMESAFPNLTTVQGEPINAGRATTFSEYSVVSENRVYPQPVAVEDQAAVLFGCALLTGGGIVLNQAQPVMGESVLISGLGGVGLSALIAAKGLGVTVVAADPDPQKRKIATELGVACTVDPSVQALPIQLRRFFPNGVDIAIDAAGTTQAIESAFSCLRYGGGRLIFASHPATGERITLDPHDLIKGRRIEGSWGGACHPERDIPRLAHLIAASGINLDFMMPRTYALDEVNEALEDLDEQRAIRPIIDLRRGNR